MTMTTNTGSPPSVQTCIVGGGVGGCAAAASLLSSFSSSASPEARNVLLLEMGRGVGGRASTRFTREDARIAINHGAPHAEIKTETGRVIMKQLEDKGFAQPSQISGSNDNNDSSTQYWTGNPTMNRLSDGLLELAHKQPQYLFRNMVREVEPIFSQSQEPNMVQGWRLKDKDGNILVETEWLIVAGSGMAHPRWTAAFGGDPPLLAAAKQVGSPALDQALETIGSVHSQAVQTALMAFDLTNEANTVFRHIDTGILQTPNDPVLEKLVFQTNDDKTLLSIVAHSNAAFAETAKDTYGSKSTAARIGGATSSADREQEVLGTLMDAVKRVLVDHSYIETEIHCPAPSWGPHLHRWGNAFPKGKSLPMKDAIVEDAKIAFCGDYVGSEERFGSFEGALVSGHEVGKRLQHVLTAK